jgi:aspartyl-tRNA(Asn)/glutamyl-tRNA(Gln) amidotransferase subunit B
VTVSLRVKEEEMDYRYFPEADLPPYIITKELIEEVRASLPELPDARRERLIKQYSLPPQTADILTSHKALADFFESSVKEYPGSPLKMANWIVSDILGYLNRNDLDPSSLKLKPKDFAAVVKAVEEGVINEKTGKTLILKAAATGESIEEELFPAVSKIKDEAVIASFVDKVFKENEKAVKDALTNERAVNYLIGLVMKASGGKADPHLTRAIIISRLNKERV